MEKVQIFQDKKVRTHWDAEREEWYFSVVDVVAVLTDSVNPTDYLKKMRKRDPELATFLGTNCPQVDMITATGRNEKHLLPIASRFSVLSSPFLRPKPSLWRAFKKWFLNNILNMLCFCSHFSENIKIFYRYSKLFAYVEKNKASIV